MEIKETQVNSLDYALLTLSTAQDVRCQYFLDYPDIKITGLSEKTQDQLEKEGIIAYMLCKYDIVWTPVVSMCPNQSCSKALDDYMTKVLNKGYSKYSDETKRG